MFKLMDKKNNCNFTLKMCLTGPLFRWKFLWWVYLSKHSSESIHMDKSFQHYSQTQDFFKILNEEDFNSISDLLSVY